ncbi:BTAD domain-containing putative transcriptional regulator [Micromonospora sp. WMMD1082]|uniref:BTAD domain-containing putative transcriptional regulator n=1 Tax=Micromonospora sp. WMMD1082 TaxID=3016104 RepID=UPI0024159C6B|nr:BTAD domain-containing putative transcriptional regulator [Micromonospora sp. WMMD1082]MDG4793456.1 BTAD domain-containing putative transcriptional regulator [Micromonospora sp. WMMD1082]
MAVAEDRVLNRRCTFVVAAAGYGKTLTVRGWLRDRVARWCAGAEAVDLTTDHPERLAALGARWVAELPADGPGWIVLDDVPRLSHPQSQTLLATVELLPRRLRVVVLTRYPPAPAPRRQAGLLVEHAAAELAFSPEQVMTVLADHGLADPTLATRIHAHTAGWPALVALAARAAGAGNADGQEWAGPGTPLESYLLREVFAELPAQVCRLLRDAAHLDPVHADLCQILGHRRGERLLAQWARAGLLRPLTADGQEYRVVPVVAEVARRCLPLSAAELTRLHARVAPWYVEHGCPVPALRSYARLGAARATAQLLADHGAGMLVSGGAEEIVTAFRSLPEQARSADLRLLYGEALQVRGDFDASIAEYATLAGRRECLTAGLAWRYGLVHYLRGKPRCAADIFRRRRLDAHPSIDNVRLLSWSAAAYWMTGDATACRDSARRALAAAMAVGGDDALAAAHAALALEAKLRGDRPATDEHHDKALRAAEAARDTVQVTRIRTNRASALVGESRYLEALAELRPAVELAYANGYVAMLALALCNEGAAFFRLGRLDEATACYERAIPILQRMGSQNVAYALVGVGEIHALRGRTTLARAAYEEALRASETAADLQAQVPALAGLARVLAGEDAATATALAQRAVERERGPDSATARLALGWVVLETGDRLRAAEVAAMASEAARRHRDRAALAEALELRGAAATGTDDTRRAWREAVAILRDIRSPVAADRLTVLLGRMSGADPAERLAAQLAAERLVLVEVPAPTVSRSDDVARVRIHTLGRFALFVDGAQVPTVAWQSRKARDLLRILASRRGRATPREQLGELLWPGQDPGRVSHRLSVALSTLRTVLDPGRRASTDHFVVAAHASLALDVSHVELDVEDFLTESTHGLRLAEQGDTDGARATLLLAERRYRGDFLEDEPYDDWSRSTRDDVRRVYLRVVRTLAALARGAHEVDEAVRHLGRALDLEPYDEGVHGEFIRTLVAAGRHGEAGEAYRRYTEAMSTIGVRAQARRDLCGTATGPT